MLLENNRVENRTDPPSRSAILAQLDEILRSPAFRSSKRSQEILVHLVHHALEGNVEELKERVIGQEIFGRPLDYDTGQDSIVRAKLNEVRRRLAQYFDEAGDSATVRIEIPVGTYSPEFHWIHPRPALPPAPKRSRTALLVGGGIALVLLAAVALYTLLGRPPSAFESFWQPFLQSPKTITLCVAHPKVFNIFGEEADELVLTYKPGTAPPPGATTRVDRHYSAVIIPEPYNYVGIGDAHAVAYVYGLFQAREKACVIRRGNEMTFAELRSTPSVLIGGSQWAASLMRELRYVVNSVLTVFDQQENKEVASIGALPRGLPDSYVDYAIISRLIRSRTGEPLLGVVGLSHYGTMAAGELVTNKGELERVLSTVEGWSPDKNCQMVIRVNVLIRTPERPEVVASHIW
ncbi:MAG TPA: hypothetical protein PKW45_19195 [Bryobacteraceae bacterium]|nr:hypothetical protein [Bryobacteraceae bacterium]